MKYVNGKRIVNLVCDSCVGVLYQIGTEIQLLHKDGCPNKWREDTFLLSLAVEGIGVIAKKKYSKSKKAKLNPGIHQKFWDGEITQEQAQSQNRILQLQRKS